jgi:hypothetical protein
MVPRPIAAVCIVLGLISFQVESFAAAPSVKGWVLQQDNPHTGVWNVFLSSAGMAAVNKKMGCTLVTKAPQWNVVMYNDKTKVYFLSPLSEWKGASLKAATGKTGAKGQQAYKSMLVEKKPKKLEEGEILGHKASKYLTDNLASTGLKKVEFWVTPDVQAPPELKQVFSKIYGVGLSSMQGLPLRVSYIDENGKRTPVFTTTKIDSQQIPLSNFTYPSSYKRVDSEIAVLMDEKGREAMASIMDDMGDGQGGDDINSLLENGPKKKTASASGAKSAEGGEGGDPLADPDEKKKDDKAAEGAEKKAVASNNGDWGKAIYEWFMNILRSLGLASKEEGAEGEH